MVENGSPVEITSSGVIEAPASELWALVSDFGDVARWHPDVTSSRLESGSGNEAGAVRSIRLRNGLSAFLMVVASSNMAFAQSAKLDKNATISQIEDYSVGPVERLLVRAADAMPEDKYVFAPTNGEFKGVRTFAQHVKHVAVSNYVMAAAILQEKAPVELGGNDAN